MSLGKSNLGRTTGSTPTRDTLSIQSRQLPQFMNVEDVARLLRTTRKAIYVMVAREQLTGVVHLGRRLLFRTDLLIEFLNHKTAPSPKE